MTEPKTLKITKIESNDFPSIFKSKLEKPSLPTLFPHPPIIYKRNPFVSDKKNIHLIKLNSPMTFFKTFRKSFIDNGKGVHGFISETTGKPDVNGKLKV